MCKNIILVLFTIITLSSELFANVKTTSSWAEARDSSTISISDNRIRSTADGTDNFGMSKEITDLIVGHEYTLSYSFLTGSSKNSYGRITEDSRGSVMRYSLFENKNTDKEGHLTFIATQTTMYIVFFSTTDNAYIELESINIEGEGLLSTIKLNTFSDWLKLRDSSIVNLLENASFETNTNGLADNFKVINNNSLSYLVEKIDGQNANTFTSTDLSEQHYFYQNVFDNFTVGDDISASIQYEMDKLNTVDSLQLKVEFKNEDRSTISDLRVDYIPGISANSGSLTTEIGKIPEGTVRIVYWVIFKVEGKINLLNPSLITGEIEDTYSNLLSSLSVEKIEDTYTNLLKNASFETNTNGLADNFKVINNNSLSYLVEKIDGQNANTFTSTDLSEQHYFYQNVFDNFTVGDDISASIQYEIDKYNEIDSLQLKVEFKNEDRSTISDLRAQYISGNSITNGILTTETGKIPEGTVRIVYWVIFKVAGELSLFNPSLIIGEVNTNKTVVSNSIKFDTEVIEEVASTSQGNETLISGKLYIEEELSLWKKRSVNGPFKTTGDAYLKSRGEYDAIKTYAEMLLDTDDADIILNGTCKPLDSNNSSTALHYTAFGKFQYARDAAFVDLVEGTNKYTNRVKNLILTQAQKPCMDFSNRTLYPYDNKDSVWLYAEWMHKVLKAYDFLDEEVFTTQEKTIIDNWFKGAADWFDYVITNRIMDKIYTKRASMPENSIIKFSYWGNNKIGSQVYKKSPKHHIPGSWINNRQLGIANFITNVGVKYDNDVWKDIGSQLVKEYISFHFDENGYFAELNRATVSNPRYGLAYGANTLINVAEIAHILYNDGHINLFEYKSNATIDHDTGDIKIGNVEKSLEWVLIKYRENFMEPYSPEIYPLGNTNEVSSQVMHFCSNTRSDARRTIGRMYSSAAIINRYYKNDLIKEIYASEKGNLCGFTDNLEIRSGPNSIAPGYLFQYADVD